MMQDRVGIGTDTGRVRSNNEDASIIREELGLRRPLRRHGGAPCRRGGEPDSPSRSSRRPGDHGYGLRGTAAGRRKGRCRRSAAASAESSPGDSALLEAARAAQLGRLREGAIRAEFAGMGCTLVALHLVAGRSLVRDGRRQQALPAPRRTLLQVSDDHTRLRMLERMGVTLEAIDARRIRGVLTRAVGTHHELDVDYGQGEPLDGDLWLLCSDGLTDELDDEAIRSILQARAIPEAPPEPACGARSRPVDGTTCR